MTVKHTSYETYGSHKEERTEQYSNYLLIEQFSDSKVITPLPLLRLVIGLKESRPVFQPMRSKTKTNRTMYA